MRASATWYDQGSDVTLLVSRRIKKDDIEIP